MGFVRNNILNANSFFSNRAGGKTPAFHSEPISGSTSWRAGGQEQDVLVFQRGSTSARTRPTTYNFTTPTAKAAPGRLLRHHQQQWQPDGDCRSHDDGINGSGGYTRTAFTGNVIPTGRISSVAAAVISRYPSRLPQALNLAGTNNYFAQVASIYNGSNYTARRRRKLQAAPRVCPLVAQLWLPRNTYAVKLSVRVVWVSSRATVSGRNFHRSERCDRDQPDHGPLLPREVTPAGRRIGTHDTFDPTVLGFPTALVSQNATA